MEVRLKDCGKIKGRENLSQILESLLLWRVLKLLCFDFLKGFAEQEDLYLCKRHRWEGHRYRSWFTTAEILVFIEGRPWIWIKTIVKKAEHVYIRHWKSEVQSPPPGHQCASWCSSPSLEYLRKFLWSERRWINSCVNDMDRRKDVALRGALESTRLYTTAVILAGEYSFLNS